MTYPAKRRRRSVKKPAASVSLLKRELWSDPNAPWLEEHIQAAIAIDLRQNNNAFEIGMEGVRLSRSQRAKAKIQGMEPGRCDLRVYFPERRMVHIELKRKGGRVSAEQKAWHERLRSFGFDVHVIVASCPQDGVDKVRAVLSEYE